MSDLKVAHNNLWKRPSAVSVRDAGTWKTVRTIYVNDAGAWKPVWTAPGAQLILSDTTFTVPAGVYSICVAAISAGLGGNNGGAYDASGGGPGGAGGDGGSLAYKNDIAVTPGDTFSVSYLFARVSFGALYVLNGRAGVSSGWDVSYLGGVGGLAEPQAGTRNEGYPAGEGGYAATWIAAGRAGGNAPGGTPAAQGGRGVDAYGVVRDSAGSGNGAASGEYSFDGFAGSTYGGGGGGGSGQIYVGAGPFSGGVGGPGAVRIIWGTGKSFPDGANFS